MQNNLPSSTDTFPASEPGNALECMDEWGFCVVEQMIESLQNHLKSYADGHTGYDGAWRGDD